MQILSGRTLKSVAFGYLKKPSKCGLGEILRQTIEDGKISRDGFLPKPSARWILLFFCSFGLLDELLIRRPRGSLRSS